MAQEFRLDNQPIESPRAVRSPKKEEEEEVVALPEAKLRTVPKPMDLAYLQTIAKKLDTSGHVDQKEKEKARKEREQIREGYKFF